VSSCSSLLQHNNNLSVSSFSITFTVRAYASFFINLWVGCPLLLHYYPMTTRGRSDDNI
jgi:hypothetical protein